MGFVAEKSDKTSGGAAPAPAPEQQAASPLRGKELGEQDAMLRPGGDGLQSARFAAFSDFGQALSGAAYLKPGHSNKGAVAALQESLAGLGFAVGTIDGLWGNATTGGLKQFQSKSSAKPDAIIGPSTMGALDKADAGAGSPAPPKSKDKAGGAAPKTQGGGGGGGQTAAPPAKGGGQTADLEEKKKETQAKQHEKPSPEVIAKKEAEFQSEGTSSLAAVQGLGGPRLGGGGDTKGAAIQGYPGWFTELQDWLVNSGSWSETHENAQNVLYRYAMWKTEADLGYVPPSVEFFFRYIGKSDGNNKAVKDAGFKGAEDLGGRGGSKNWCAEATTKAAEQGLKERGLKFRGGLGAWIQRHAGKSKAGSYWCARANGVELKSGDQVSYLGKNHNNTTGHRVTVLENLGGGAFTHVSGNAGGGGSGSVRIGQSTRSDVPGSFSPDRGMNQPKPKPTDDTVWVYSLQQTGDVFADLAKLDGVPATDPRYDALLVELQLQRIK